MGVRHNFATNMNFFPFGNSVHSGLSCFAKWFDWKIREEKSRKTFEIFVTGFFSYIWRSNWLSYWRHRLQNCVLCRYKLRCRLWWLFAKPNFDWKLWLFSGRYGSIPDHCASKWFYRVADWLWQSIQNRHRHLPWYWKHSDCCQDSKLNSERL